MGCEEGELERPPQVAENGGVIRATTGGLDRLVADNVKAGEITIVAKRRAA